MGFINHLRCPITGAGLDTITKSKATNFPVFENYEGLHTITKGLIDKTNQYFYPIFDDIIILHQHYALYIGKDNYKREELSFDKKRVFDYYNKVSYKVKDALRIYEDSSKWVDFREVSEKYIRTSFTRASKYTGPGGKYLLDIASGPIGLPEYMHLCDGYDYRVCVDISINALIQAKINIEKAGKKGIFICGDITNIPLMDNCMDTVLSQHTLYHIPRNDQKTAVNEMYRVAKPDSKIVIVYSWFYHSWFMNLSLNVVQIYRILRHFAGKAYVRLFPSKPRLYFYPHSRRWFKKSFEFGADIEFYCWRSTNKHFLRLYIHKWLFGRKILSLISKLEDKHSKFMASFGEYPAIVITKK